MFYQFKKLLTLTLFLFLRRIFSVQIYLKFKDLHNQQLVYSNC